VGKVGRRIDRSQPLVDARLADGSRVNAVIAPLAVSGPTLTIRKFPDRKIQIHDLVALGAMSKNVCDFLQAAVLARCNILVSGGTGSGKTTLLNCLSDFIPDRERVVRTRMSKGLANTRFATSFETPCECGQIGLWWVNVEVPKRSICCKQ
jgi:pilus assembly protein CpaF